MEQKKQSPLQNLAYINQKCMQAKAAGVFDDVEITCLWNALDAIHHELLIQEFPAFANISASNNACSGLAFLLADQECPHCHGIGWHLSPCPTQASH